jgi:hypothetical protein
LIQHSLFAVIISLRSLGGTPMVNVYLEQGDQMILSKKVKIAQNVANI